MPTDVNRLLTQMQTGEYIPTDEEKTLLEQATQGPQRRTLGQAAIDQLSYNQFDARRQDALGMEAALAGYGQSRYDRGEFAPDADLENKRAIEQPGVWKIANGAIKGGVYAATTAVETVAGVINGLLEGTYELGRQIAEGDKLSVSNAIGKGVNNFTARTMQDIQKLSDEWFPNYRTTEERSPEYQENWQRHIFSANFIGDQFLKNFGFTVGAIGGGMVWSKILGSALRAKSANDLMKGITAAAIGDKDAAAALKATSELVKAGAAQTLNEEAIRKGIISGAKGLNKASAKQMMFGSVIGAMGEGTMEGVMAREEFMDNYIEQLNNDYLQSREDARTRLTEELKGTGYTRAELQLDENGNIVPVYTLNEKGEELLRKEQDKLAEDYTSKRNFAEEQGDKIAATTFLFNLPILTASNTVQFGRLFSGGWKTTRNALSKVSGGITNNAGKITANYASTGNKALKIAKNAIKVGGAEAAEEMAQGFVSSGATKVADARVTAFNDDGYDIDTMKGIGTWLNNFLEGGGEYLSDWKNWQEGFMGLITGLVGMPGKGYFSGQRGGLAEAISDAKEDIKASKTAAEALNNRVNSKKFKDTWEGYVRHMKYEAQMGNAVEKDDQYSWRTANDKQLVSDIIMFADAGRLQDLYDLVDTYASMSPQEAEAKGVTEAVASESNQNEVANNPEETLNKIKKQAESVKETIKMYNDMYDALSSRAPIGTSSTQLKELIATSMGIRAFEKRYLTMFDEVIKGLDKYVKPLSLTDVEGNKLNPEQSLARAKDIYSSFAEIYTGTGLPVDTPLLRAAEIMETMNSLGKMIDEAKDTELRKKMDDMQKVAEDRQAFIKKLFTLQNLSPEKFEEHAKTPDKAADDVKKEKARIEMEGLDTMDDVRNRYLERDARGRADFLNTISPLDGSDPAITSFLSLKNAIDKFRAYVENNGVNADDEMVTPQMVNNAMNDLIRRVNTVSELERLPDSAFASSNEFMLNNSTIFGTPPSISTYESLKKALRNTMAVYLGKASQTESKDTIDPNKEIVAQPGTVIPEGYDAAQPGSNGPAPVAQQSESKTKEEVAAAVAEEPDEDTGNDVDDVTEDDAIEDAIDAGTEVLSEEVRSETVEVQGMKPKIPYYRTSVPEISTAEALKARAAIAMRDVKALKEIDLSDFAEKNPKYAETWNALNDRHAFDNVASVLSVGDKVSIVIDPNFPTYNGKYQPLLVTYKNGEPVVLSVLSAQTSQYYGLEDLRIAIDEEYENADKTQLFVFSKKSRVWAKRPGIVEYGSEERGIINIPNYSADAPIVYIDKNGHANVVNGKDPNAIFEVSPTFADADYNKTHKRRRALYYLAQNGDNAYIPIRLKKAEGAILERDATGKITNLQQLIDDGLITSNAVKLRPKGVDFYMDAWIPEAGKFGLVTDVQREYVQEEVEQPREENTRTVEDVLDEDTFGGRDDFDFGDNISEDSREGFAPQQEVPPMSFATTIKDYDSLNMFQKADLKEKGYSKEEFDKMSDIEKQKVLECL